MKDTYPLFVSLILNSLPQKPEKPKTNLTLPQKR